MADEQDPIDIEVPEDEKPEEADIVVEKTEEKPAEKPVDDEIETLKANLEREKLARQAAETRATEASHIAAQRTNETAESNLNLVVNAISTVKQTQEILKGNLSAAMAAQDFDESADIQVKMAENAATLQTLEQGKNNLESAPKVQPTQGDPVEALAAQLSPRSAQWVRDHPEYARDQRLYGKMLAAHNLAMADGVPADSDDYFREIEKTLRIAPADAETPMSDAAAPVQRRSAPPAAPVSRSGTGDGRSRNRVTLSPDEREMAQMAGMTDQEYAREKLALIKEGKLTTH